MIKATVNGTRVYEIEQSESKWLLNGEQTDYDAGWPENGIGSVVLGGRSYTVIIDQVDRENKEVKLRIDGIAHTVGIQEKLDLLLSSMGMDMAALKKAEPVKSPMPGLIVKILVVAGQTVQKGEGLIVLEAMKMENLLKAPAAGVVKAVAVQERTAVEKGTILIEME